MSARPIGADWVVFGCDHHQFGVPIQRVREIVTPLPFTRLPGSGPEICGLIGLRGRVVTVIDFGAAFGIRRSSERADFRIVLLDRGEALVGLAVERVVGVARTGRELELPGASLAVLDAGREELLGVSALDGSPFVVTDPDRILDRLLE
ncbi:MAG: chemotaxis protein CheW [Longimicrobiales bacterium]